MDQTQSDTKSLRRLGLRDHRCDAADRSSSASTRFWRVGRFFVLRALFLLVAQNWRIGVAEDNEGQPRLNVQIGHVYPIQSVAISPDGNLVLTGAWDNTAILWDAKTGRELRRFSGHQQVVASVAFTPDGHNAVTMGWGDGSNEIIPVRIWDLESGQLSMEHRRPQPANGTFARVLSNGEIVTFEDATIWNTSKGQPLLGVAGAGVCTSFALSRDGDVAVVGGFVASRIVDLENRRVSENISSNPTTAVSVSLDGTFAFMAFEEQDCGVVFKNLVNPARPNTKPPDAWTEFVCELESEKRSKILDAAFSLDNAILATAHDDGIVRLWKIPEGKIVMQCQGHDGGVMALAFSNDGKKLLTGSVDRTARLWDIASGREIMRFSGKAHYVQCVAFAKSRHDLVTSDWNGTINSWNLRSNRVQQLTSNTSFIATAATFGQDPQLTLLVDTNNLGEVSTTKTLVRAFVAGRESLRFQIPQLVYGPRPIPLVNSRNSDKFLATAIIPVTSTSATPRIESTGQLVVIDIKGDIQQVLGGETGKINAVSFGKSSNVALTGGEDGVVRLWDVEKGAEPDSFVVGIGPVHSLDFAPDDRSFVVGGKNGASVWSRDSHSQLKSLVSSSVQAVMFSPRGDRVLGWADRPVGLYETESYIGLWSVDSGEQVYRFQSRNQMAHPSGLLMGNEFGFGLLNRAAIPKTPSLEPRLDRAVPPIAFSPDGSSVLFAEDNNAVLIGGLIEGGFSEIRRTFVGHTAPVQTVAFSPDGSLVATGSWDGTTRLWRASDATEIARLVSFADGSWLARDSDGRFDTNELDRITGLHWLFPDEPFRGLAPEIFLRDYYEPRLLSRLLSGEQPRRVRELGSLNRVQPTVAIADVKDANDRSQASVTVQVAANEGVYKGGGKIITKQTDAYDVRLFRDGQLVGQWPEPPVGQDAEFEPDPTSASDMQKWRELNRVVPHGSRVTTTPDGKMAITFPVRLPHRDTAGPVEFTAYAFNEDRVKSETARFTYEAPANPTATKPRAYLIGMGVSVSQNPSWNLKFAANDARLTVEEFSKSLSQYDVVPVLLTSESGIAPPTATRENLRTVLQLLSGHDVPEENKAGLPNADQLQLVTPDDLVLVAFSGHGYTDLRGILHLLPYDVGGNWEQFEEVLPHCISSGDLATWLKDVDAGELVLILDACHSAAAGAPPGFKPGPLGGRGLAQLAYDKGMRVLAASQADDVALESEKIQHGLLTYALIRDGLQARRAAPDDKLTFSKLLAYSADRVPVLYEEVLQGEVKSIQGRQVDPIKPKDSEQSRAQRPELFDYANKRSDIDLRLRD